MIYATKTGKTLVIISLGDKYYEVATYIENIDDAIYDILNIFIGYNVLEVYSEYTDGVEDYYESI